MFQVAPRPISDARSLPTSGVPKMGMGGLDPHSSKIWFSGLSKCVMKFFKKIVSPHFQEFEGLCLKRVFWAAPPDPHYYSPRYASCPPSYEWGHSGSAREIKGVRKGSGRPPHKTDGPGQVSSLTRTSPYLRIKSCTPLYLDHSPRSHVCSLAAVFLLWNTTPFLLAQHCWNIC